MKRIGNVTLELLRWLGTGVAIMYIASTPRGSRKLTSAAIDALDKNSQKYFNRLAHKLATDGYIDLDLDRVKLTDKGKRLLRDHYIFNISIPKGKWDGVWHIVSYDIPNDLTKQRDLFRLALKNIVFIKIQKSLMAIPYECKEEVAVIAKQLDVNKHVVYMNASELPGSKDLIKLFFG